MKTLSLSWFGFTMLTLVHAASIPDTDYPFGPTGDAPFADYPDQPPTEDDLFAIYGDHPPTEDAPFTDSPDQPPTEDAPFADYPDQPPTEDDLFAIYGDHPPTEDAPFTDSPDQPPTEDAPFTDSPDQPPTEDRDYHLDFTCPDGWTMHSTQCLLFVPQNMTWKEAKENCASKLEGSLAAVYNDIQAQEIYSEMESVGHHGGQVWVGGSKTSEDSSWSWEDSVFPSFAKFCDEQSSKDENNCLQLSFGDDDSGCLSGTKCDAGLPSVCAILLY
ncbi:lithostathine-like isoform X6 [Xiphophorus hellerii]|uniref:lithostathine-like isoform X6 n=1 Tax=Xiphophorus hellerii TaxID=8084 RepID=UPI0013B3A831|nr:lithostathine-like isoform X6 [Xiphophorus hellerii]